MPILPLLRVTPTGPEETELVDVYFHCSNERGVLIDRNGTAVDDLADAREHATRLARSLIVTPSAEDWRSWVLHITDDDGEEIFEVPFATLLGKPH
jgi:hypothetical protein